MAPFDGVVLPLASILARILFICGSFLGPICFWQVYKLVIMWLQASHGALKGVAGTICPATTREHHTYVYFKEIA